MFNSLSLFKILSGLSRTIDVARQIIPIFSGIGPIIKKSSDVIGKINLNYPNLNNKKNVQIKNSNHSNIGPTFFQ